MTETDAVFCPPNVDCPCYAKLTAEIARLRAELAARDAEVVLLNAQLDESIRAWAAVAITEDTMTAKATLREYIADLIRDSKEPTYERIADAVIAAVRSATPTPSLEEVVTGVLAANPDKVEQVKANPTLMGWFVGQVMKATKGTVASQDVNDLLNALLTTPAAPESGWRPIQTAPKDGTEILVFDKSVGVFSARRDEELGIWFTLRGPRDDLYDPQPTHWMPLPPPPKKEPVA